MSTRYNPSIVRDNIVQYLDAANTKSYPGSGTTWTDLSSSGNNVTLTNWPTYSSSTGGGSGGGNGAAIRRTSGFSVTINNSGTVQGSTTDTGVN